jgi:hypothetical protein
MLGVFGLSSTVLVSRGFERFWWRRFIRFSERGLLWDRHVIYWDRIVQHRWTDTLPSDLEILGIDQRNWDVRLIIPVPIEQRETIQGILDAKSPRKHLPVGNGRTIETVAIPDSSTGSDLRHQPIGLLLWLTIVFAYLFWMEPHLGVASRPINEGIIAAIVISSLPLLKFRPNVADAGAFVVRLRKRANFLGALTGLIILTSACVIALSVDVWNTWLARSIGFVGALAGEFAMTQLHFWPLDLRQHGVVLASRHYWPWQAVSVVAWNASSDDPIRIRCGMRRISASVPVGQRQIVDDLLRDKGSREKVAEKR